MIALWLGHEGTATTHRYIEANLALKEQALSRIEEMPSPPLRYRADDELLRFLGGCDAIMPSGHTRRPRKPEAGGGGLRIIEDWALEALCGAPHKASSGTSGSSSWRGHPSSRHGRRSE